MKDDATTTQVMIEDNEARIRDIYHLVANQVSPYIEPVGRIVLACMVIWYASGASSNRRFFSGSLMAFLTAFLTFAYLEPFFVSLDSEPAMAVFYVLIINGTMVGLSLGLMLPVVCAGISFGAVLSLLAVTISGVLHPYYFAILGGTVAFLCAALAARLGSLFLFSMAAVLEFGAVAACLVSHQVLPSLADAGRGYSIEVTTSEVVDVVVDAASNATASVDLEDALALKENLGAVAFWMVSSLLIIALSIYRDGFSNFNLIQLLRAPAAPTGTGPPPAPPKSPKKSIPTHKDSTVHEAFNMFDPANLPPRLAEYANMVYSACEDIGNFFGFQDSSVRNQAEHLLVLLSNNRRYMSSHILPPSIQPPSPIHALHAKVFSNYVKWCRAMGIPPNFSKMNTSMNAPPAVASRVVDLVLFFCIWGEASNLRHMPECLWFLYHKMMEEYIQSEGYTQTRSLYAGHYLDNVVTPIYEIVFKSMKSSKDHEEKRNYDDFNEFFWSRNCLLYRYSSENPADKTELDLQGSFMGPLPGEFLPAVTEALKDAPKTFLEKRSWLRGILALNRIIEWHIVTFYLLGVIAFSRELVWGWVETVQLSSVVFWIFNAIHLSWAMLEVWASYPGIHLSGTEVCGATFILLARFLMLIYQTLYLMWAFTPDAVHLGIDEDANFWWWQYIWLSVIVMIPYAFETLLQLFPPLTAKIYTSQNEYVQSFLHILYPISRLYVGKEVQESLSHTIVYVFFWVTLMIWKLFFSYVFEVYSMVLPTLQLTDDYLNYGNQSFFEMMLLLSVRWLPQWFVYIIDMSIWYAVWQAFAGTSVGFSDHLGDIRSMEDIRQNFGQAPENFCKKMLSPDAGSRRGSSASFLGSSANMGENAPLLAGDSNKLQSYMNRLLDVRIQKWVMFSAAWNEIIDHFRNEDIISNTECDNLKFSQFDGFNQAIYLPVFQTAGVIDNVLAELERPAEDYKDRDGKFDDQSFFRPIAEHITMQTAVAEVWELGVFFLVQVFGPVHSNDVQAIVSYIDKWFESGKATRKMKLEKIRKVFKDFVDAVRLLQKGISKRKPAGKARSQVKKAAESKPKAQVKPSSIRRAVSVGSLSSLDTDAKPRETKQREQKTAEIPSFTGASIDALRDQVRDKLRNFIHSVKGILESRDADDEVKDVLDRLTFLASMENGFFWDDAYASDQLDEISKNHTFKAVLKTMFGLMCMHPDDVEPKSKEVKRRLTFFVNSLFMDMPEAPSIHDMFSWNVLTPYYSEDVTYSKGDLEKRTDALGVSTLLYLQTLYKADWANFLERMGLKDDEKIWTPKHVEETRRWASIRAQTLSRTVNGMMYCEKALRLLANLERLDDDTTNDLLCEKFGYVVSTQVYGNMKRNQDHKAEDIEALMHRFPHMRIAYIDTVRVNRSGASVFYSVLMKSDGKGSIQEIYRVRLPGNPVIGEGKPENQNHAMIFTRGEFVQTIDMNQEGYFEEALKMRNCLQEFAKREGPLPTTILGLREHIFTGSVSSLANYMALQEISFVTLGQRVLTRPLHIRLHYGHPDVFDKLFFITRGGVSKASKGINLSEDIFAGYSNVIRGGTVGFKEYVQVGKGRDVGQSQIYKFEAKLSQGNAEQSLSRDVYRMCHRLDFCRLLSFYYGGIGHYFSNVLTITTVYIVVYLMVVLAIFDLERIGNRLITPAGTVQMMLGGLGLLQTIPLFATLGVERGWVASLQEIFHVFITGGPLHFMFHIQTKATYFAQTILVGGAKYRPTGRGFVTQHTPFDEQFRFFAASHLYLGVELGAGLILMGMYTDAGQYVGRTWSLWLASASFLCSPFWFNPLTFDWNVVVSDYEIWLKWIRGVSGGSTKSWSMWWNEENSFYKSMPLSSKAFYLIKAALHLLIAEGIRRSDLYRSDDYLSPPSVKVSSILIGIVVVTLVSQVFTANERSMPYPVRRTIGIVLFLGLVGCIIALFFEDSDYIRYALAAYYAVGALSLVGLLCGYKFVKPCYFVHDVVCAHIIFIPLFIAAALQLPGMIQTWLLYHNALSTDVVVSDILRYARRSQESVSGQESNEELIDQITELKKIVQKQEEILSSVGLMSSGGNGDNSTVGASTIATALSTAISPAPTSETITPRPQPYTRAVSMSGLDVWGNMALGDVHTEDLRQQMGRGPEPPNVMSTQATHDNHGFSFSQPEAMPPRFG